MKAAVCRQFAKPLALEELTLSAPQAGEVVVQIRACAICHSDLIYIDGGWGGRLPKVFGHEAAGEIVEIGEGVEAAAPGLAVGDAVLVTLLRSCGHCASCEAGRPSICESVFPLDREVRMHDRQGAPVKQGLRTGAFAEYAIVHHSQLAHIPDDLPPTSAALLSCGVITGVGAVVNTAQLPAFASTAVIGCGGVGLNALQGAALSGATPLIAIDLNEAKLRIAAQFGADECINASDSEVRPRIDQLTANRGLEYVFTAAGNPKAIELGVSLLAPGGALVIVGMPASGDFVRIDATDLASAGRRILGSKMGATRLRTDIPQLIGLYRAGKLKLDELISGRYPLSDINHAIDEVRAERAIRHVIEM